MKNLGISFIFLLKKPSQPSLLFLSHEGAVQASR